LKSSSDHTEILILFLRLLVNNEILDDPIGKMLESTDNWMSWVQLSTYLYWVACGGGGGEIIEIYNVPFITLPRRYSASQSTSRRYNSNALFLKSGYFLMGDWNITCGQHCRNRVSLNPTRRLAS
ncbi:hypothetical protein J6590_014387, partial [Homalodisca vitripennis]